MLLLHKLTNTNFFPQKWGIRYFNFRRMIKAHCTCQRRERSWWVMFGWIHQLWCWSCSLQCWVQEDVCYCWVLDKWKPPHQPRMRDWCPQSIPQMPPKDKDHKSQRMWTIWTLVKHKLKSNSCFILHENVHVKITWKYPKNYFNAFALSGKSCAFPEKLLSLLAKSLRSFAKTFAFTPISYIFPIRSL